MRTFLLQDGDRKHVLHYDGHRAIVYDHNGRSYNFPREASDLDVAKASAWEILARISRAIAVAEDKRDALEALAQRCREGWVPTPAEIPTGIKKRTMHHTNMAVDALAYPDDLDGQFNQPATRIMGTPTDGSLRGSGEILWLAPDRSYAVCDDTFYWLPPSE